MRSLSAILFFTAAVAPSLAAPVDPLQGRSGDAILDRRDFIRFFQSGGRLFGFVDKGPVPVPAVISNATDLNRKRDDDAGSANATQGAPFTLPPPSFDVGAFIEGLLNATSALPGADADSDSSNSTSPLTLPPQQFNLGAFLQSLLNATSALPGQSGADDGSSNSTSAPAFPLPGQSLANGTDDGISLSATSSEPDPADGDDDGDSTPPPFTLPPEEPLKRHLVGVMNRELQRRSVAEARSLFTQILNQTLPFAAEDVKREVSRTPIFGRSNKISKRADRFYARALQDELLKLAVLGAR